MSSQMNRLQLQFLLVVGLRLVVAQDVMLCEPIVAESNLQQDGNGAWLHIVTVDVSNNCNDVTVTYEILPSPGCEQGSSDDSAIVNVNRTSTLSLIIIENEAIRTAFCSIVIQVMELSSTIPLDDKRVDVTFQDIPTPSPTPSPTRDPTPMPSPTPTDAPTAAPTGNPTAEPSPSPTSAPTPSPTPVSTAPPTGSPTPMPTNVPTNMPTPIPTSMPTLLPTSVPTPAPTLSSNSDTSTSNDKGFFERRDWLFWLLLFVVIGVVLGVTYLVVDCHRKSRRRQLRDWNCTCKDPTSKTGKTGLLGFFDSPTNLENPDDLCDYCQTRAKQTSKTTLTSAEAAIQGGVADDDAELAAASVKAAAAKMPRSPMMGSNLQLAAAASKRHGGGGGGVGGGGGRKHYDLSPEAPSREHSVRSSPGPDPRRNGRTADYDPFASDANIDVNAPNAKTAPAPEVNAHSPGAAPEGGANDNAEAHADVVAHADVDAHADAEELGGESPL